MKHLLLACLVSSFALFSCKKDANTNQPVVKKIKKVTSSSSDSKIVTKSYYEYDSNDNISSIVYTETDTTTGTTFSDTIRTLSFQYNNNFPSDVVVTTHKTNRSSAGTSVLTNTFYRHNFFDNQNRIVLDSLVSANIQYSYTGNNSFKDTIAYLTDRRVLYNNNTQITTFSNSHLLNTPFTWVYDTSTFVNGNLISEQNKSYLNGQYISFSKSSTYTNYSNPLYIGIVPQFGQSQQLPLQDVYTYFGISISVNYQYTVDATGTVLSSTENTFNTSTGAAKAITSYYEYY